MSEQPRTTGKAEVLSGTDLTTGAGAREQEITARAIDEWRKYLYPTFDRDVFYRLLADLTAPGWNEPRMEVAALKAIIPLLLSSPAPSAPPHRRWSMTFGELPRAPSAPLDLRGPEHVRDLIARWRYESGAAPECIENPVQARSVQLTLRACADELEAAVAASSPLPLPQNANSDALLGNAGRANAGSHAPVAAWQPIATAPKQIEYRNGRSAYGPWVLVYQAHGRPVCARWWEVEGDPVESHVCNWLMAGGNAVHPTHWMPLPDPPESSPSSSALL